MKGTLLKPKNLESVADHIQNFLGPRMFVYAFTSKLTGKMPQVIPNLRFVAVELDYERSEIIIHCQNGNQNTPHKIRLVAGNSQENASFVNFDGNSLLIYGPRGEGWEILYGKITIVE